MDFDEYLEQDSFKAIYNPWSEAFKNHYGWHYTSTWLFYQDYLNLLKEQPQYELDPNDTGNAALKAAFNRFSEREFKSNWINNFVDSYFKFITDEVIARPYSIWKKGYDYAQKNIYNESALKKAIKKTWQDLTGGISEGIKTIAESGAGIIGDTIKNVVNSVVKNPWIIILIAAVIYFKFIRK